MSEVDQPNAEHIPAGSPASPGLAIPKEELDRTSISDLLIDIGQEAKSERMTIGELTKQLEDRAFGFLLLILALPCCIPFLYGIPQAVSLPLIFVSAQIIAGRHNLWLPERVKKRSFERATFQKMTQQAKPYLKWLEVLSQPRLCWLTHGLSERIFGVFILLFSTSIMVPLPGTNTVPGCAVALMALGFIERDGVLMIIGTIVGIVWVTLLMTVGTGALILAIDWLKSVF